MPMIRIVTDSTADLPAEIREQLGIEMVPLEVLFGEESYLDSVTITPDDFYQKLEASSKPPTTSQPASVTFASTYERILAEQPDTQILSIHLAAALSGTYQSAVIGSSMVEGEGAANITVFDSKSASSGCGILVLKAAEMARIGCTMDEIVEEITRMRKATHLYFLVDTLEYLQKGGRIGKASALIGSILNIKPILTLDEDGVVTSVDKVRGQKKAMNRIVELFGNDFGTQEPVAVTVAYAQHTGVADELCALLKATFNVDHITYYELGPVIGTHAGPGTVGLFMHRV
ncbi:degV family protein [Paenibacillus curdlanolyticus YK9]|uniref:DegV family protein n=1 Tax=Paenibacillus curdlanolyticus YK9 TaxID=717606 RepID=E0I3V0_9BACL|nr:degV family protein [Paenibacillus curdlanolyticus YK9]